MKRSPAFMQKTYNIHRHQKLRAEKAGVKLPYSLEELRLFTERWQGRPCPYCAEPIDERAISVDHVMPVSRGGSYALTNAYVCCERCNQTKGNLSGREFGAIQGVVFQMDEAAIKATFARMRAGARFYK